MYRVAQIAAAHKRVPAHPAPSKSGARSSGSRSVKSVSLRSSPPNRADSSKADPVDGFVVVVVWISAGIPASLDADGGDDDGGGGGGGNAKDMDSSNPVLLRF